MSDMSKKGTIISFGDSSDFAVAIARPILGAIATDGIVRGA